jgi:hypothetical protein
VAEWLKAPVLKSAHYRFSRNIQSLYMPAAPAGALFIYEIPIWRLSTASRFLMAFSPISPGTSFDFLR